jgi:hypothetical protein
MVGACTVAVASLVLSCLVVVDALHFWRLTDVELVAQLRGQSHMDILGFGFWPTWTVVAILQSLLYFSGWALMRPAQLLRPAATLLLAAFIAASAFNYQQVARIEHLLEVGSAVRQQ